MTARKCGSGGIRGYGTGELVRTEVLLVVGEASFDGGDHIIDVVAVGRCGVDLDVDASGDAEAK